MEFRLVPNQSENGRYNLISVGKTRINNNNINIILTTGLILRHYAVQFIAICLPHNIQHRLKT